MSSDENFGIFKVSNMFLHIICLYCIGVHLSRTISGQLILLFLDVLQAFENMPQIDM